MSWMDELGEQIKDVVKRYIKNETLCTAAELDQLAKYILDRPDLGYSLAYRKASPEKRIDMRNETNDLMKTAKNKALARKAARQVFVYQLIQMILSAAVMAINEELE